MNSKDNLKYRMYGFVPYNISDIQKGIQFGHAVVEYANLYSQNENYQKWANEDKTFIILDGGTTNNNPSKFGTLNQLRLGCDELFGETAAFHEPDLGDQLMAFVFLVDERVWDEEKFSDIYVQNVIKTYGFQGMKQYQKGNFPSRESNIEQEWILVLKQRKILNDKKLA